MLASLPASVPIARVARYRPIRLSAPPAHGDVTVKQGKLRTTNLRQCLAAEVPAYIVNYKSKPGFSGSDVLTLEVINSNGKSQLQKITVTLKRVPVVRKSSARRLSNERTVLRALR